MDLRHYVALLQSNTSPATSEFPAASKVVWFPRKIQTTLLSTFPVVSPVTPFFQRKVQGTKWEIRPLSFQFHTTWLNFLKPLQRRKGQIRPMWSDTNAFSSNNPQHNGRSPVKDDRRCANYRHHETFEDFFLFAGTVLHFILERVFPNNNNNVW